MTAIVIRLLILGYLVFNFLQQIESKKKLNFYLHKFHEILKKLYIHLFNKLAAVKTKEVPQEILFSS